MRWLAVHHSAFCFGADHSVIDLARSALEEAALAGNNPVQPDGSFQAEGGSATGAFVAFERCSDTVGKLHGASIGDSAVIAVRMKDQRARQLNPVFRKHDRDTGGQVTMCFGVDGPVWAFASEVSFDELIILTTDGFTDNVSPAEMDQVVPLVIKAQIFDSIVPGECGIVSGDHPEQPGAEYLRALTRGRTDDLRSVSCETAARRLFNYVEWVTRTHHREEQEYYELCLRLRAAHGTEGASALQEQVSGLMASRKASRKVVKTDDAMIVVLRPFHAVPYR